MLAVAIPGYLSIDINQDIDGLDNVHNLGTGGTAFIIKAKLKAPSLIVKHGFNDVAIKIIKDDDKSSQTISENVRKSFLFEVTIMNHLPASQNIVRLIGYSSEPMAIVMKYYPLSLKDLLKRKDYEATVEVVLKIAFDIAQGMKIIHNSGVLHLDLKPRK